MIIWWLQKGLDDFRIDAIINIKKDLRFQDFPADREDGLSSIDKMLEAAKSVGDMLTELREETFDKFNAFTVGEVFNNREDELYKFIGGYGMTNNKFESIKEFDDISTIAQYNVAIKESLSEEESLNIVNIYSRDNARTPFQWDDSENAGFTNEKPWLQVNENYKTINAKLQFDDEDSVLSFYKSL